MNRWSATRVWLLLFGCLSLCSEAVFADDLVERFTAGRITGGELAEEMILWSASHPEKDVPEQWLALRGTLDDSVAKSLLREGVRRLEEKGSVGAIGIIKLFRAVVPAENINFQRFIRAVHLTERSELLRSTGKIDELITLYRDSTNSEFQPVIAAPLRALAEEQLQSFSGAKALEYAAKIPFPLSAEKVTPLIVAVDREAIGAEQAELFSTSADVRRVIWELSEQDPGIKIIGGNLYDRLVRQSAIDNQLSQVQPLFSELLRFRPDPNPKNVELRQMIIESAETPEMISYAAGRVEELRQANALSFGTQLILMRRGFYGDLIPPAARSCLGDGVGCGRVVYCTTPFDSPSGQGSERQATQAELAEKMEGPGYLRPASGKDEYTHLLALFGLEDGVTEEEIRKVYRDMSKSLHPDRLDQNDPQYGEQVEKFRDLQEAYERLLKVRGSWFGGRRYE